MKKKGFTLIELLAVIVILAIIALIATPLVLKYIEKSRQESKVDSAYSFVRNLETEIANYSIKNKGTKYNKAPIGGDYYEFKDFDTDNEIDTKVKGDNPENIKLCLSSLGLVEKGVFQYGNYYVSYDGKKGSIIDKDTYDNFSCSGKSNDNNVEEAFTINVTIEEIDDDGDIFYRGEITDIEPFDYDDEHYYNFYIDGVAYKSLFASANIDGFSMKALVGKHPYIYVDLNGQLMIQGNNDTTIGSHQFKLEKTTEEIYPHAIKIGGDTKNGYSMDVISGELQAVDTTIVVKDNSNNVIAEETFTDIEDMSGYNYLTFSLYSDDAYELVQQGQTITVEVTQIIDGKSVTTTLGGTSFTKSDGTYEGLDCELPNSYYWGNELLPADIYGC